MFEKFYNSSAQQPSLLWTAIFVGIIFTLKRLGGLRNLGALREFAIFWTVVSIADAWLTATPILGLGLAIAPWSELLPLLFVLAGC